MEHGNTVEWKEEKSTKVKTKIGIYMFFLYTIVYAGFIVINLVKPQLMKVLIGSQNLAFVYGIGLIIFALLLAVIYNYWCTKAEKKLDTPTGGEEDDL